MASVGALTVVFWVNRVRRRFNVLDVSCPAAGARAVGGLRIFAGKPQVTGGVGDGVDVTQTSLERQANIFVAALGGRRRGVVLPPSGGRLVRGDPSGGAVGGSGWAGVGWRGGPLF